MAGENKAIFGMTEATAQAVSAMLGRAGGDNALNPAQRPMAIMLGKTKAGGIAANGSANVIYREPTATGWTDSATEYPATNPTSQPIAANKLVILFPVNGVFVAFEIC